MNKSGEAAGDLTFSMPGDRKGGLVPNLGFDKDHVLSDADSLSVPPDNKVTLLCILLGNFFAFNLIFIF